MMESLLSRRTFFQHCSAIATGVGMGVVHPMGWGTLGGGISMDATPHARRDAERVAYSAARAEPDLVKALALRALDAARNAGASYADVRLVRISAGVHCRDLGDTRGVVIGVGVRCLMNGYWGFAAGTPWTPDNVVAVAQRAAAIAKTNARGVARSTELAPAPVVIGEWSTPGAIDPFTISPEEFSDYYWSSGQLLERWYGSVVGGHGHQFSPGLFVERRECALATSAGTYVTQTTYHSAAGDAYSFAIPGVENVKGRAVPLPNVFGTFTGLSLAGKGFELFRDADLEAQLPRLFAEWEETAYLPVKPIQPGYVNVVVDSQVMAALVNATLGTATELDRAVGYEANSSGTSYLGPDPLALLGTAQASAPLLTLTATRAQPGGCATVHWDDEGVEPEDVALVKDGVLMDYQTTREQATWLAPYYQKRGVAVRSHGYAASESAFRSPVQHHPDFVVRPATSPATMAELVKEVKLGVAVIATSVHADWQARNGRIGPSGVLPRLREIVNGKLGAWIAGDAELVFKSPDLWRNLVALGGPDSAERWGFSNTKGQPAQSMPNSVRAVPGVFKHVALLDSTRGV